MSENSKPDVAGLKVISSKSNISDGGRRDLKDDGRIDRLAGELEAAQEFAQADFGALRRRIEVLEAAVADLTVESR